MHTPLTRAQARLVDKIAIEEYGIPGIVLMENAARAVADEAILALRFQLNRNKNNPSALKVAVMCGGGNNGGDGFAVARHLHNSGIHVKIFALSDPKKLVGDAKINFKITQKMNCDGAAILNSSQLRQSVFEWMQQDLIVDAILGTGFSGELKPHISECIAVINSLTGSKPRPFVLAVDLPSGLDCDTGIPSSPTIRADTTVTFVAPKIGFSNPDAQSFLGKVIVAGIGAPREIVDRVLRQCS